MTHSEQSKLYDHLTLRGAGRREMIVREMARKVIKGDHLTFRGAHAFPVATPRWFTDEHGLRQSHATVSVDIAPWLCEGWAGDPDTLLVVEREVRNQLEKIWGPADA